MLSLSACMDGACMLNFDDLYRIRQISIVAEMVQGRQIVKLGFEVKLVRASDSSSSAIQPTL